MSFKRTVRARRISSDRLLAFAIRFCVVAWSVIGASMFPAPAFAATPLTDPGAFERLLLPVLTPPVHGALGSEFRTEFIVINKNQQKEIELFGLSLNCAVLCPPVDPLTTPIEVGRDFQQIEPRDIVPEGTPGRFVYAPKADLDKLAMNLRVADVSRSTLNFGTELPIVRSRDFTLEDIVLPSVPVTPLFRSTLRVYAAQPTTVTVFLFGPVPPASPPLSWPEPITLHLRAGLNFFDPAYAATSDFPAYNSVNAPHIGNVLITQSPEKFTCLECQPTIPRVPIWAFVSITNNVTQHITLVTPQP
jgi:hypothetical protein